MSRVRAASHSGEVSCEQHLALVQGEGMTVTAAGEGREGRKGGEKQGGTRGKVPGFPV